MDMGNKKKCTHDTHKALTGSLEGTHRELTGSLKEAILYTAQRTGFYPQTIKLLEIIKRSPSCPR